MGPSRCRDATAAEKKKNQKVSIFLSLTFFSDFFFLFQTARSEQEKKREKAG